MYEDRIEQEDRLLKEALFDQVGAARGRGIGWEGLSGRVSASEGLAATGSGAWSWW